ncbi:NF-kappa-B inhibitor beta [Alosa pseudoharengus]|uniref:NF-kappa-B inhibitor beta n=1 Tax=Alosa sapidissima TaxID=34773 RepID=UPI001C09385F|nr:NF-kappa-B inhibitor beta [Alosa sapidissima]
MAGIQRHSMEDSNGDSSNKYPRPAVGCELKLGSPNAASDDWCDSGLDSISGVGLSIDGSYDIESPSAWSSTRPKDCCPSLGHAEDRSEDCTSVEPGERLDSAIGDSITDETVGSLSQGLGTLILAEQAVGNTVDTGRSERVSVVSPEEERQRREELFNTLNFLSEDGDTALHLALIHEHRAFVQYLLGVIALETSWTPYLDIQNHLGQTALHLAVIVDQPECVRGLLWGGASAELQERGGNTPLHLAVRELRMECVKELTSCPRLSYEHLSVTNYSGVSALHVAVQKGRSDIINMLLSAGADVNQRDLGSGRSPLHWAVEAQSAQLVALLLSAGAAVDQRSYAGHTALYCALHRPNREVQALLRAGGAVDTPMQEEEEDDDEEEEQESEEEEFDDVVINGQRVM